MTKKKVKQGEIGGVAVFFIAFLIAICLLAMGHGFYHMGIVTGAAIDRAFVTEEELHSEIRDFHYKNVLGEYADIDHNHDKDYSKKGHEHPGGINPWHDDGIIIVPGEPIWSGGPGDILDDCDYDGTVIDTLEFTTDFNCNPVLECSKEVL